VPDDFKKENAVPGNLFAADNKICYVRFKPALLMSTRSKQRVKKFFHRNGVLEMEQSFRGDKLHGASRTWYRNGQLATEEFYHDGLLHGIVRQWNSSGKLLGSYDMQDGTGTQKCWHENGKLRRECITVGGRIYGRIRLWLSDGNLISEGILLEGRPATAAEYRRAAARDSRLPLLSAGGTSKMSRKGPALQKHIQRIFVLDLLKRGNQSEARAWIQAADNRGRSLGRFPTIKIAATFIEELYRAGALKVIVPDIYQNRRGDQFADGLLVKLPEKSATRKQIRAACSHLRKSRRGVLQPETDLKEAYLYINMS
jgi:hypothetical protein